MINFNQLKTLFLTKKSVGKFTGQAVINRIKNKNDAKKMREQALTITSQNSREILSQLNIKINTHLSRNDLFRRNYFMVSNHMSYVDILILSSIQPAVFVTSVEMEKTFFLGDMAKLGGSFFVNRVNRRKIKDEVDSLINLLNQGFNVFLFPEGTSTNGSSILPFKKSLFRVPHQTKYPILPICLKYRSIDNEPFSEKNCDKICWHGDMGFTPHFLQLMGIKNLVVDVHYLEPIESKNYLNHGDLSDATREAIAQVYNSKETY